MSRARIALGLVLVAAASASAQSLPPITKTKESATRAVQATNAHTATMTADQGTPPASPTAAAPARADTGSAGLATQTSSGTTAVPKTAERPAPAPFEREVFDYQSGGRRDPFVSLMSTGDLRPVITDLQVVGIVFDEAGRGSVAILKDLSNKEQYRVRVGQSIGRNRVARIDTKSVTFTIEEFGFSRQETLALVDPNKARTQ
jgi:hypothetical protein